MTVAKRQVRLAKGDIMPAQNRVTPFGEIVAYAERGKSLGNRGELKVEGGQLVGVTRWKTQSQ